MAEGVEGCYSPKGTTGPSDSSGSTGVAGTVSTGTSSNIDRGLWDLFAKIAKPRLVTMNRAATPAVVRVRKLADARPVIKPPPPDPPLPMPSAPPSLRWSKISATKDTANTK